MTDLPEIEKAIARQKGYIGASVITFFVYWLFYLPGLIVNLLYLNDAKKTAKIAGQKPAGYGCLVALLVIGLFPLIAIILVLVFFVFNTSSGSAPFVYTLF